MEDKGINKGGAWFLHREADCDDRDSGDDMEYLFDCDTDGSIVSDLIDDNEVIQGNTQQLLHQQRCEDDQRAINVLKRKYSSSPGPSAVQELSPKLDAVRLTPRHKQIKRRLFDHSAQKSNEAEGISRTPLSEVQIGSLSTRNSPNRLNCSQESYVEERDNSNKENLLTLLLKSKNQKATAYSQFKTFFGISYTDLVRQFKSDRTCNNNWVVAVFGPSETLIESSKRLLLSHCCYIQLVTAFCNSGILALYLLQFSTAKCRLTLQKLFTNLLNVNNIQLLSDPPKHRSTVTALWFYKKSLCETTFVYGDYPGWLAKLTLVTHQANSEVFDFSGMVQWAYDNNYTDEPSVAYNYAQYAKEDPNAAAWLKLTSQAKIVTDCVKMVRLYKRHEMRIMTMSEWIWKCCDSVEGEGDWKVVMKLLRYQNINAVAFLASLRDMFKGRPKRHCLVLQGQPNTGKSYFGYSLIQFLEGAVISFANHQSHFWLQPLTDAKIGLLDDATYACWTYMDVYMRNGLDGNAISVDCKFKAPTEIKLPPLIITTNIAVDKEEKFKFLHSRCMCYNFNKPCLFDNAGNPVFRLTQQNWKAFFQKLRLQLGLEAPDNGVSDRAFRCSAGPDPEPN